MLCLAKELQGKLKLHLNKSQELISLSNKWHTHSRSILEFTGWTTCITCLLSLFLPVNLSKVKSHMYLQIDPSTEQPAAHTDRYGSREKYLKALVQPCGQIGKFKGSKREHKTYTCEAGLAREGLMTWWVGLWETMGEARRERGVCHEIGVEEVLLWNLVMSCRSFLFGSRKEEPTWREGDKNRKCTGYDFVIF